MRGRDRLVLALAALVLAILPGYARAQTQPGTPPAPSQKTAVFLFAPYTSRGLNSDVKVSRTITATCDMSSQVDINRPDAWACTDAGKTYDPCFANSDSTELACPDLPAVSTGSVAAAALMSVVVVHPRRPINPDEANTPGADATPFLIELVDGQFCVPEPADIRFASLLIFGYCTYGYWFGPGDLSKDLWTLPILQGSGSPSLSQLLNIGILRVWY